MTQHSTPRSLELRLLRCSLSPPTLTTASSPPPQPPISLSHHHRLAEEAVCLIEKGNYIAALSSDAARVVFELSQSSDFQDSVDCAQSFYTGLQKKVESLLQQDGLECGILVFSIAVAALLAFVQNNITGPYENFPSFPFPGLQGMSIGSEWDVWARNHLMSTGSDLSAKFSLLQYIVYAKMLLTTIKDISWEDKLKFGVVSVPWWLFRLLLLQQRILADHTSSLFDSLKVLKLETVARFGKLERIESYWGTLLHEGEASTIVSLAHLEVGMIDYTYGWIDQARCSLGDVTNTDTCYEKALEVSHNKSARAKRSLARTAYNRGDYEASKILWESALAMNSLFPDGWFAFGAAALKARDIEKALDGFTRAVQLDPDNGEAWNNIACLHMIKNKNKEAFIAFKEALKYRRNNWQCWENYSQVAVNIGNFGQALEATKMVLSMTNNKRVDTDLLKRILVEIESRLTKRSSADSVGEPNNEDHNSAPSHETEQLVEFLGNVLKQCVCNGVGEDIWGLYARWHKIKGDLTMCSEALLKQVRSYQGSDLWSNHDRYKKFASASLELCEVYIEIALCTGSRRELRSAELHLRNTIKQAAANFSEMEETKALQSCLEEVRRRNQAT